MRLNKLIVGLLVSSGIVYGGEAKTINICVDNDWFPYTFMQDKKLVGTHIDIVKKGIEKSGYKAVFKPMPWKRCLKFAEIGKVDAIMPASYKDKRAEFAHYPNDAKTAKKSKYRIDQIEYMLITKKDNSYEYNGNYETIPQPISIGFGASLGDTLKKSGRKVKENKTNLGSISMLLSDRVKSVVLNPIQAKIFNTSGKSKDKLKIHKIPLKGKSYHLIFSKKGSVSKEERETIWNSFIDVRNDEKFMIDTFLKYKK